MSEARRRLEQIFVTMCIFVALATVFVMWILSDIWNVLVAILEKMP